MILKDTLKQNKTEIVQHWFDMIIESYPAGSANFFKQTKNRFGNPVGYTYSTEIETIYDSLIDETYNNDKLKSALDSIIKIRSVQDFSPSQAVSFIFILKDVVRKYLDNNLKDSQVSNELLELESKIDKFALLSFDIYMNCREKISEIRVNESKRKTEILLKKINSTSGHPEQIKDQ